jgi:N-acetylglucosaminyl-diphospho-decaprenol L-rhamnosyltransferase
VPSTVSTLVVSWNNRDFLGRCLESLPSDSEIVVVDNASTDGSASTVADLPIAVIELGENRGFAAGCNAGWQADPDADFVLFLNPDATIDADSVRRLARVAEQPGAGAAAPRILEGDGSVAPSLRRFPRLRSTFAQALFLHRLARDAAWSTELIHDPAAYQRPWNPEWVSGACMLLKRQTVERLGGLDEGFFMYCEDKDLCRRLWDLGLGVRYEPEAVAVHHGGASAPRTALLPVLATSRIRYAHKHAGRAAALGERIAVALWALTHLVVSRGGRAARAGYAQALRVALGPLPDDGGRRFVPAAPGQVAA